MDDQANGVGEEKTAQAGAQLNVRLPDEVKAKFQAMMEKIRKPVRQTGGGELTQTALLRYWATWMSGLDFEAQKHWARTYKQAEQARIDGMESSAEAAASEHKRPTGSWSLDDRPADKEDENPAREVKSLPKRMRRKKV